MDLELNIAELCAPQALRYAHCKVRKMPSRHLSNLLSAMYCFAGPNQYRSTPPPSSNIVSQDCIIPSLIPGE